MNVLIFATCVAVAYVSGRLHAYYSDLEFEREIEAMYADPDYIAKKRKGEIKL